MTPGDVPARGACGCAHGPAGCGCPRRGGRRVRRGWVREAMLALLAERPMHGYEMICELAARTGGSWRPSPGSVYPTLQALEDEGLVAPAAEGGRRSYALTDAGRQVATVPGRPSPWAEFPSPPPSQDAPLRVAADHLIGAVGQVLLGGTADQKARAAQVLDGARRVVYGILAEEPPVAADRAQYGLSEP
jgi:hypothetical protein